MRTGKQMCKYSSSASPPPFWFPSCLYALPLCLFSSSDNWGKSHRAFGSAGVIQHPVCHNTGTAHSRNCQLMAVYPLHKCASQCLSRLRTCQPMIVELCTLQTSACQITGCSFWSQLSLKLLFFLGK